MYLKLGSLGVAVAVALLLAAVAAPAANAEGHYVCATEPCIATGENVGAIVVENGGNSIECEGVLQGTSATAEGSSGLGTVHSSSCTKGTLTMNHCAYVPGNETVEGKAAVSLECAEGNEVEFTVEGCTLSYGPQEVPEAVHYTNVEGKVTSEGSAGLIPTSTSGLNCIFLSEESVVSAKATTTCYEDFGEEVTGTATTTAQETSLGEEVECSVSE